MVKQCHITLVDFGFARALSPTDVKTDIGLKKVNQESEMAPKMEQAAPTIVEVNKFGNASCINQALDDPSRNKGTESRGRGRTRELNTDNSISHAKVRDLSEFCYIYYQPIGSFSSQGSRDTITQISFYCRCPWNSQLCCTGDHVWYPKLSGIFE
mmetsp:Transcript_15888/g.28708  ORF Transcript_15888/g.28708 Transcript_15888/m.28708 type:complete len:155 (+) Transcript_15888:736-1200(+)